MSRTLSASETVGSIAAGVGGAARVFEELAIDYCCGGRKPLDQVCAARGLELVPVMERLRAAAEAPGEQDWSRATMTALADHIESRHHAYLKTELPRLAKLVEKVQRAHGQRHPELEGVRGAFQALSRDMFAHMEKEEKVLFPALRALEAGAAARPLDGPIDQMVHEHDEAAALLREMRSLTAGFTPPADACTSFRVLLNGLAALEKDLHRHVHKENNILFPAARRAVSARVTKVGDRVSTQADGAVGVGGAVEA
jgi:regulator of cell morphogenesis and NO signaling